MHELFSSMVHVLCAEEVAFSTMLGVVRPAVAGPSKKFLLPGQRERYKPNKMTVAADGGDGSTSTDAAAPRVTLKSAVTKLTSVLALSRALLGPQPSQPSTEAR